METGKLIVERTKKLSKDVSSVNFSFDGFIYNPLDYAWQPHKAFLERYVNHEVKTLFLGMNPGPFGMMQTGVPFGEINAVKNYLHICEKVGVPASQHPKRLICGFDLKRSEISGLRLWNLIQTSYPNADDFFREHTVFNYCPLAFISSSATAKNITPDSLVKCERDALDKVCLEYLSDIIKLLKPSFLIGVGKYAEKKLSEVAEGQVVASIVHPSPGNPMANNGWAEKTLKQLKEIGIWN